MSLDSMDGARAYAAGLLVGERSRLRVLREEDLPVLEEWWNLPEVAILQTAAVRPRPVGPVAEMIRDWSGNGAEGAVGFAVEDLEGTLVGHAVLYGAEPRTRCATYAVVLGPEHQGKGLGPDVTRLVLRYGFREMGLHRIELGVWAYNDRAVAAYRKAGFVEEGRRREVAFHDGAFHDQLLMGVLAHEWWAEQG